MVMVVISVYRNAKQKLQKHGLKQTTKDLFVSSKIE
jgi:hypothetical protein